MPLLKKSYALDDAMDLFREKGMADKEKVFQYRRSSFVNVYEMEGYFDYYYGCRAHISLIAHRILQCKKFQPAASYRPLEQLPYLTVYRHNRNPSDVMADCLKP